MHALKLTVRLSKHLKCNATWNRYLSDEVRVRFAPSPTGFLHLGGLRTALYNHLFAKARNGVTILRIEDTDVTRTVPLAAEKLIEDLAWCGIVYDEGPFFQSKRVEIYKKYAQQLVDQGDAYYCFCSEMRLNLLRKETLKAGEIPKYDNNCRKLSKQEVEENLKNGQPYCIRFKLNMFNESVNDMVLGPMNCHTTDTDGDPIILKSDGFPTYHLANVVDDHLMNITHVLRGIEWQISVTKHLLLFKAFKWKPPVYGHLPLLLNPNGKKLSKRQGDAQIGTLRENGFFPNAILNFLIRFGGGFNIDSKTRDLRSFTFEELLELFDISKVKSSSCKICLDDLNNYNNLEIIRLLQTEEGKKILLKPTQDLVHKHFQDRGIQNVNLSDEHIVKILELMKNRINKLEDLISRNYSFIWAIENKWEERDEPTVNALKKFMSKCETLEWTHDSIKDCLKEVAKENDLNFSNFLKTLRLVLCGGQGGPSIAQIMELLGKKQIVDHLSKVLN